MLAHRINTRINKKGYLELRNLPFTKGTEIEVIILKKKKQKDLQKLINNNHIWSSEDIMVVEKGREIINQWKIS